MRPLSRSRARIALSVWTAAIVAATVPWTDFVGHTHWQKVQWIPFVSPPVKPFDIVGNLVLYVPFGYSLMRGWPPGRAWRAAAIAGALSFSIEWSQLYSHSRFPSVQDVMCNVCGSWVGAWLAHRQRSPANSA